VQQKDGFIDKNDAKEPDSGNAISSPVLHGTK
jgi:hypothetical protein